jgi:ketol-acid reductoisomerase
VQTPAEASAWADVIMVLAPDTAQRKIYAESIAPNLPPARRSSSATASNIRFELIKPPADVDVAMVAPKGPGHLVRRQYVDGKGVPASVAVEQDPTAAPRARARPTPRRSAATGAGVIKTTFKEETRDRPVRRAGRPLRRHRGAGADRLRGAHRGGYAPEIAYFECLHELKLIVDLMYEGGIARMRYSVSDTAEFGDYTRGPRVIDAGSSRR